MCFNAPSPRVPVNSEPVVEESADVLQLGGDVPVAARQTARASLEAARSSGPAQPAR